MNLKDFFKPTKIKIGLTIVFFVLYLVFFFPKLECASVAKGCPSDNAGVAGINIKPAQTVPFSCEQACTALEYVYILTGVLITRFLIPLIVLYVISSFLVVLFNKLKK